MFTSNVSILTARDLLSQFALSSSFEDEEPRRPVLHWPPLKMIRSCRIPPVLDRICDGKIRTALLVTADGELLGASTPQALPSKEASPTVPKSSSSPPSSAALSSKLLQEDPEAFGALVAEIALGYCRLGEEYAAVDAVQRSRSHMQCLLMEMDAGLIAVSSCLGCDCFVIAVAEPDAPPGLLKARLQALAVHVQEAFSTVS